MIELVTCTVLVLALSLFALWKMDYLNPATAHHIRMTDSTRTAYVAKNIAEGRGYTTKELPAFLVDFYDQQGKLHDESWVNADRFPFTAYAVAALYLVTGSTSEEVGILLYNLIFFVAFFVVLYWLARAIWDDRWAALCTVAVALLHPRTYVYLYLKDADMMLLTVASMFAFYRYLVRPPGSLSLKGALAFGTVLALLYLARPNIGLAFMLCFGVFALRRLWSESRTLGMGAALREVARREGIVVLTIVLWCIPFVVHSMSEWGTPMFSANAKYQLPLGTRFAMHTDTWWKYSEPGHLVTLGTVFDRAPGELFAKFTTSWLATLKQVMHAWGIELVAGLGLLAFWARRTAPTAPDVHEQASQSAFLRLAKVVGATVLINIALLPLYGYQNYGYGHYLSFGLPLLWLALGRGIVLFGIHVRPALREIGSWLQRRSRYVLLFSVAALLVWNFGRHSQDGNPLFVKTAVFVYRHWLITSLILGAVILRRFVVPRSAFRRAALMACVLVLAVYQPKLETKTYNLMWFPADTAVWKTLSEGKGLVMSLAMQGEVNWVSGRKNIPAPEFVMHVYSLLEDHDLEVEDVYIESAETMLASAFHFAAPGFESYVRMQKYGAPLPGYAIVFHESAMKAYPKYKIKPLPKASTVYRLVDRDAVREVLRSPARIELGDPLNVMYTAHGWGEYAELDGKPVVAATDVTRARYVDMDADDRPWEDTSATFFLDDRRPSAVDLEVYATHATTLQFYWNLDLYYYNSPDERRQHAIGTYEVTKPGWQRIRLEVPRGLTRKGLNKLGFRTTTFQPVTFCPSTATDCAPHRVESDDRKAPRTNKVPHNDTAPLVFRDDAVQTPTPMFASLLVHSLEFEYGEP